MQKYLDLKNDKNYTKFKEPAQEIQNGGIVVFPTETVYGIGVNALNEEAIELLLKQKPENKTS